MTATEKAKGSVGVLKQTASDFSEDDCMSSAAAIAYYSIFSLPPIIVLIIMLAGWLGQGSAVSGAIEEQINQAAGPGAYDEVQGMAAKAQKSGSNIIASIVGFVALIFSATGVMAQLQASLNKAWEVEPDPNQGGVKNFLLKRLLSFGMILTLAFLLLVSTVMTIMLTTLGDEISSRLGIPEAFAHVVPYAVNLVVITLLFAAMFKFLPDAKVRWKDVLIGALFTAVLFVLGKLAIGFYIGWADVESSYGSAGKLVAILVWFYYSAIIILFGAEFTQAWAKRYGTEIQPSGGAVKVVEEKRQVRGPEDRPEPGFRGTART